MDIKVQCDCGGRYAFSVEPVNGVMPVTVTCPRCGTDGTAKANLVIQQSLVAVAEPVAEVAVPTAAPAPAKVGLRVGRTHTPAPSSTPPSVPAAAAAPPPPPAAPASAPPMKTGLRVGKTHKPEPAATPPVTAASAEPAVTESAVSARPMPRSAAPKGPSFGLGVAGAVLGAVLGAAIWLAVFHFTGLRIRYLAFAIGALAGFGARVLGRDTSNGLGGVAALSCLVAILGCQFYMAKSEMDSTLDKIVPAETYDQKLAHAKEAVALKSDAEITEFVKKERVAMLQRFADKEELKEPIQITSDDIKMFKEFELPQYKEFADGKPTREEYDKQMADVNTAVRDNPVTKVILVVKSIGIFSLVTNCLSIGMAFKIASGANG